MSFNFSTFLFNLFLSNIYFLPTNLLHFLGLYNPKFTKIQKVFGITEYKLKYEGRHFSTFLLSLLFDISEILKEIQKKFKQDKIVNIFSTVSFKEPATIISFHYSLHADNLLYSFHELSQWPYYFIVSLIKKMDLYPSFTELTITIQVSTIKKL